MTGKPATEAPVNGGRNYNGPALEFGLAILKIRGDTIMGFGVDKLPREGEQTKAEGERLGKVLFGQWVIDHPIVP
jgi:hypothetical protein